MVVNLKGDMNLYNSADDFLLIVACLHEGQPMCNYFAAFTRNWMVRQENDEYDVPGLSGNVFDSYFNL